MATKEAPERRKPIPEIPFYSTIDAEHRRTIKISTATIHVSPKSNSGECQVMFPRQPETVASHLSPENLKHLSTGPAQNEMPSVEWPASSRGKIVRLRGRWGAHVVANHGILTEVEPVKPQKQQLPSIREALPGLFTKDV
ncbi:hypothetical protein RAB80_018257 [Fusarium oxysporum f. sp. vasinfectum]|nr:hypothetical protein RAB80_018257 [Fusarium oxysporum f. sp. vasinfectum]